MSNDQEIVRRLDTLVRLIAAAICAGRPQKDGIKILADAGMAPKDIAELLGTTPNSVSVALYELRKSKSKRVVRRKAKSVVSEVAPAEPVASE